MNHHQFQNWLDFGEFDLLQPEEGAPSTIDQSGPSPNSLIPHQDPLQPTQFLSQLPLFGSTLKTRRKKNSWTLSESQRMLELHNELGNRWSTLSKKIPGKSENDIKNHFFSQLRMSLRCLNKLLVKPHLKKQQSIKPLILFKISNFCEEQFNKATTVGEDLIQQALKLKQKLFNFLDLPDQTKKQEYQELVKELKQFIIKTSKGCKGRGKYKTEESNSQQIAQSQFPSSSSNIEVQSLNSQIQTFKEKKGETVETKEDIMRPEDSTELIARPSFCLQNPLSQWELGFQEGDPWDKQMRPFECNFLFEEDSCRSQCLFPFEFKPFEL